MPSETRTARIQQVAHQRTPHLALAAEHVHHRHNVSALLRTADALGILHVWLVGELPFRPSRGAARGAHQWLELHHHTTVDAAVQDIHDHGYAIWAADLADPPIAPEHVPVDKPVCVWLGSEVKGVGETVLAAADGVVTLPMFGMPQSLNVSVAGALILDRINQRIRAEHPNEGRLRPEEAEALARAWVQRDGS